MGISRFASRIRDHGSVNVIGRKGESRNDHAIIDGPSLAHSLLGNAPEEGNDGSVMPRTSYDALGKAALAWLDNLQEHGFEIEAIYFDGGLPEHKKDTRIERLQAYVDKLAVYKAVHDDLAKATRNSRSGISPEQFARRMETAQKSLPPPPFLVFAVIDALKESKFAKRTLVVNGEADEFCAAEAFNMSSQADKSQTSIFTNDSDLVIYGLPEGVRVVQINEMNKGEDENVQMLKSLAFWPHRLRSLNNGDTTADLLRPAYLMKRDPHLPFKSALNQAEREDSAFDSSDFKAFAASYDLKDTHCRLSNLEAVMKTHPGAHQFLDSRVSELLQKAVQERNRIRRARTWYAAKDARMLERTKSDLANGWDGIKALQKLDHADGYDAKDFAIDQEAQDLTPTGLDLFLPVLFEDPSRATSWKSSLLIREVAVSLATTVCGRPAVVQEYKRSGQRIRETPCGRTSTDACIGLLAQWTREWTEMLDSMSSSQRDVCRWRLLVIKLLLDDMAGAEMTMPTAHEVRNALEGRPLIDWSMVHFNAQFEAQYYSLRILKQVCGFVFDAEKDDGSDGLEEHVQQMLDTLKTLPGIAAFCDWSMTTISNESDRPQWQEAVARLLKDCGVAERPVGEKVKSKRGGDKEKRKKRKVEKRSQNAFAFLENMDED